jgi:hypothetical protein
MRSRVPFPTLPWGFFLEGVDSHGDHGLGGLVELTFKASRGTSCITIHLLGTTQLRLIGVPNLEVGYTSATTGREDHEVHKGHKKHSHYSQRQLNTLLHSDLKTQPVSSSNEDRGLFPKDKGDKPVADPSPLYHCTSL